MPDVPTVTVKDPTRTTDLRLRYNAEFRRRIDRVAEFLQAIVEENTILFPGIINQAPQIGLVQIENPEQGAEDLAELQARAEAHYLTDERWMDALITAAFIRGVKHSIQDGRRNGFAFDTMTDRQILNDPFLRTPLNNLKQRNFEVLQTVVSETNNLTADRLQTVLQRGFTERRTVQQLKRDIFEAMIDTIDTGHTIDEQFHPGLRRRAELIARTEIVHAHAEAQLQYHGPRGTLLGIQIESDACPICVNLQHLVLTIAEWRSRGGIPFHPQ
jgi:hypothetical protein